MARLQASHMDLSASEGFLGGELMRMKWGSGMAEDERRRRTWMERDQSLVQFLLRRTRRAAGNIRTFDCDRCEPRMPRVLPFRFRFRNPGATRKLRSAHLVPDGHVPHSVCLGTPTRTYYRLNLLDVLM